MSFRRRVVLGWLSCAAMAGCAGGGALREPADAYGLRTGSLDRTELEAAAWTVEHDPDSAEAPRAATLLARAAYDEGRPAEVEKRLAWLEQRHPATPWLAPLTHVRLLVARDAEGSLRLLQRASAALARFPDDAAFARAARALAEPLLPACSQSDLETFLATAPDAPLAPEVALTLGRLLIARGANEDATRVLRKLIAAAPDAGPARDAAAILKELSRKTPTNPRVFGALLPASGRYAPYGLSVSQGVALAVEDMAAAGKPFEFVPVDTQEDPERAVQALDALVRDRQVAGLFGPLFSATALLCAAEANTLGVVLLTPSALTARLTQTGPYVFRVALSPEREAATAAEFAVSKKGWKRFGILAPETAYGRSLAQAFTASALALGATVLVESRFGPGSADYREAIVGAGGADVAGFKEAEEESRREAQTELEAFLQSFFTAAADAAPTATVTGAPAAGPTLVACLQLTGDPYAAELGQRLRAAALPHKTISVLAPESASAFSVSLTRAAVSAGGQLSGPEELALAELLARQADDRGAALTLLVSAAPAGQTAAAELLDCALAMYDSRTAHRLAAHEFRARRPLPPVGNRHGLEALYVPASGAQILHIVPQLVYHSLALPMLGSDTWNDEALRKRPEGVTVEAYFPASFWPEYDRPLTRRFVARYRERYAADPDALAAAGYEAALLLMDAAARSDGTREGLRQALADSGALEGLTGPMRMTPQREAEKSAVILTVRNGNIVPAE